MSRRSIVTQRTPNVQVEIAVQNETTASRSNVEYRCVWASLQRKDVTVRWEDVRELLLRLDPGESKESRENLGIEFIDNWYRITFGTSMDLINSNRTGSVFKENYLIGSF